MTTIALKQAPLKTVFWILVLLTVFALGMMTSKLLPITLGGTTLKPCATCSSCACPKTLGGVGCACPR